MDGWGSYERGRLTITVIHYERPRHRKYSGFAEGADSGPSGGDTRSSHTSHMKPARQEMISDNTHISIQFRGS